MPCGKRHKDIVEALIKAGANPNTGDNHGTLLKWDINAGDLEIVIILLNNGANVKDVKNIVHLVV